MERLTKRTISGTANIDFSGCCFKDGGRDKIAESAKRQLAIERLAAIEDILGDEYDLDRIETIMSQRMTMREEVAEKMKLVGSIPIDRLREIVEAEKRKDGLTDWRIKMKIKIDENAFVPTRAHETDAGLDLYARENQIVPAHGSAIFDTGVHVELPPFTVGDVDPKSGLFFNHDIFTHGTVDESYRGPIKVKLFNLGDVDYQVAPGDKIAQLVIKQIIRPFIQLTDVMEDTDRGNNGFGSTGR